MSSISSNNDLIPLKQCVNCDGHCCAEFTLFYKNSKKTIYSNSGYWKRLKGFGFYKKEKLSKNNFPLFGCTHYHPENKPLCCDTYNYRPYVCQTHISCDLNREDKGVKS